ncbi:hypothetical protein B296_00007179 [Ensete ventricosum]|uniref:Uncharacterized protein n=1 Tax=Ensete ventricosum TaxID=4639 RepID=A0A427B6V8_ENSVE|nr:hypothetical protein B296_00007179 [Ensete ventricosum]
MLTRTRIMSLPEGVQCVLDSMRIHNNKPVKEITLASGKAHDLKEALEIERTCNSELAKEIMSANGEACKLNEALEAERR